MHTALRGIATVLALLPPILPAASFDLPSGDDVVGEVEQVRSRHDDTLMDIARRHDLGYREIRRANPTVDALLPGEGTPVALPKQFILPEGPREGLVLNLAEMRLYYFPVANSPDPTPSQRLHSASNRVAHAPLPVMTFPIGIGQADWQTPTGQMHIISKVKSPSWTPPASVRNAYLAQGVALPDKVPPGPDNPLGKYALRLSNRNYLIHGTNKPDGIGMQVSHGCVRLYPEDIEALFHSVPLETPVTIIDQPHKVGWLGDQLFFEAHPPAYDDERTPGRSDLIKSIIKATRYRSATIDWQQVETVRRAASGIPQVIGQATDVTGLDPDTRSLAH